MPDVIDEILKFDPGTVRKKKPEEDRIAEVLKFDPGPLTPTTGKPRIPQEPVGGTFAPTGEISTITTKPVKKYIPGAEPEAGFGTLVKASFVDDPKIKAKIFAESRGIPVSNYRISKEGNVEFKNKEGKWQREVGELQTSKLKSSGAEIVGHPSTYLAPAGAIVAGPAGAVGGAMAGELVKKGVGKYVYGEKPGTLNTLADVALQGVLALAGETAGKVIGGTTNKFLGRKAGVLRKAGEEIKNQALTKEEHAIALEIKALADQHGINLAPHQLYDREGMTNTWKYLRKHPVTSDAVKGFEKKLAESTDKAVDDFIRQMGGYEQGPLAMGKEMKLAAGHRIAQEEEVRRVISAPKYEEAAKAAGKIDISEASKEVDRLLGETVKGDPSYNALLRVKQMLNKTGGDFRKLDRVKRSGIDDVLSATKTSRTLSREMKLVKDKLVSAMDEQVPGYSEARAAYRELSRPIDRLKESVIGELAEMESEKGLEIAPKKLLSIRNIRDPERLKEAVNELERGYPGIRRKVIGSYIRDVYENLRMSEEGRVINVGGKMYKALFGRPQERELMKAAMTSREFVQFESLMTVLQRSSIGVRHESMTAANLQIQAQLEGKMGSKTFRFLGHPKQTIVQWTLGRWDEIIQGRNYPELFKALIDPGAVAKLGRLRQLTPGSRRLIEGAAVLTAEIASKIPKAIREE